MGMANHPHPAGDVAAVHGMLIFGTGPIYLGHLPMFHPPHDHQLVLEVELAGPGDPAATYVKDRAQSGEPVYTWVPKPFVLSTLFGSAAVGREMQGTIVRGHFERGGKPITRNDVRAVVRRVIHAHPLAATDPRARDLSYFIVGTGAEAFAVHVITGPPDFDHVIRVNSLPASIPSSTTVVVQGRGNDSTQRIGRGERVSVTGDGAAGHTLEGLEEIYLELGDLSE